MKKAQVTIYIGEPTRQKEVCPLNSLYHVYAYDSSPL